MYGKVAELSGGSVRVELEDVLSDGGGRVIAIHRANAERNGQTLAVREALLFTIVDGKVTEIQDFSATSTRPTPSGAKSGRAVTRAALLGALDTAQHRATSTATPDSEDAQRRADPSACSQ